MSKGITWSDYNFKRSTHSIAQRAKNGCYVLKKLFLKRNTIYRDHIQPVIPEIVTTWLFIKKAHPPLRVSRDTEVSWLTERWVVGVGVVER